MFWQVNAVEWCDRGMGMDNSITQIKQNCIEAMWPDVEAEKGLFNLLSLINNRRGNTCNTFGATSYRNIAIFVAELTARVKLAIALNWLQ